MKIKTNLFTGLVICLVSTIALGAGGVVIRAFASPRLREERAERGSGEAQRGSAEPDSTEAEPAGDEKGPAAQRCVHGSVTGHVPGLYSGVWGGFHLSIRPG